MVTHSLMNVEIWKLNGMTSSYEKGWCKMNSSSDIKSMPYDTATNQPQWQQTNGVHWMRLRGRLFECIWPKTSILVWQKRQHSLCGRNFTPFMRRSPLHRSLYWSNSCSTWRWERRIRRPPTSTPSAECCLNSSRKRLTSKKKLKPLPSFLAYQQVGMYSTRHSPTSFQSWIWTNWSDKSSSRVFGKNRWDSLPMNRQNPT